MKYCTKCGAKLRDDDLFCSKCGAKQESSEKVEIVNSDDTNSVAEIKSNALYPEYRADNKTDISNTNGFAVAAIICAFVFPIAGIVFSIVGIVKSRALKGEGEALSVVSLIISIAVLFILFVTWIVLLSFAIFNY